MPRYHITDYTKQRAERLGIIVKVSRNKSKKIDVYDKSGNFICSIGSAGMSDYSTYIKSHGVEYAKRRRKLYKARHEKDRHIYGTPGFYADRLLW